MHYVPVIGVDKPISRLALGTMLFGVVNEEQGFEVLDRFVELGGNTFDTAHGYGMGKVEQALGRWLDSRGNRDTVVIIDKGCHPYGDSGPRVAPRFIHSDLNDSLERLGTDYIDLYLLHRDDETVEVGPLVEALNEERQRGRIRAFGGSNWRHERIEQANEYAEQHGLVGFSASSPNLSLAIPKEPMWAGCVSVDHEELESYRRSRIPLISWSSQAGGFFTGRFSPEDTSDSDMVRVYYSEENFARLERARELGKRKGISAIQIALAYVINQPFPVIALFGPRTIQELESSITADEVILTPGEIAYLEGDV